MSAEHVGGASAWLDRMNVKSGKKFSLRKFAFLAAMAGFLVVAGQKVLAPHKSSLRNLGQIPLTVCGTGFIDFAAFHLAHGWGWLVTGVSLIVLEHLIADDGGEL